MKSSLGNKDRYLLMQVHGAQANSQSLQAGVQKYLEEFFGAQGLASVQPKIILNACKNGNYFAMRCVRGEEMKLCASLALASKISGSQTRLEVKKISGTIRALIGKKED